MSGSSEANADAHRLERVEAVWGRPPPLEAAEQWALYPMSHPVVVATTNRRATGDVAHNPYHRLADQLQEMGFLLPLERVASICCGAGALERGLYEQGVISSCVGLDLAEGAVVSAREAAAAQGMTGLAYERRDLEREGLRLSDLDLVLAHQGVHHIFELEAVFDGVRESLAPKGVFHLHEFVGADRFQWPDRQVEEMTIWLQTLPPRYRLTASGLDKSAAGRATIAEMLAYDPSEAVRSSEIEALVSERFRIIERRPLGCTLAMMALSEIAHNFDPRVPEDVDHINRLLAREDELIEEGALGSDFVVITAVKDA